MPAELLVYASTAMLAQLSTWIIRAHLCTTLLTVLVWAWRRPPTPERLRGRTGLLKATGSWAYWVTRPMLQGLSRLHIQPSHLTLFGLACGVLAGCACAVGARGWAGLCVLYSGISDLLDGELARNGQVSSPSGAFLDSVCDRIGEVALFLGLLRVLPYPEFSGPIALSLAASLLVSYARARGEGLAVDCPGGGFERPGRLVVLMFGLMFSDVLPGGVLWVAAAVIVVAIGATGTAFIRMLAIFHLLRVAHFSPSEAFGSRSDAGT